MFDMNKIKQVAKAVGVEVNPPEANGQKGLFIRNLKGELEKWDAMRDFGLENKKSQSISQSFYVKK